MASTLIVEDGTGIANANSYDTAANVAAWCASRGTNLGTDDAITDQMILKAMDYLEAKRELYQGWRLTTTQYLQFPRDGVMAEDRGQFDLFVPRNGYENITAGAVYRQPAPLPAELKLALAMLTLQVKKGVDLQPTQQSGQFVTFQKLGPLERHFSEAIGIYVLPQMPGVEATLQPLLKLNGAIFSYRA